MGKSINPMSCSLNAKGEAHCGLRPRPHRLDEFAASYSSTGCSPAEPASASPAGFYLPFTSRNCKPPLGEGWGIFDRNNEDFSTGIDRTSGTGLKRHDFGLGRAGTRLGTPGTNLYKAPGDAAQIGVLS
jgi:hypothetical protein